MQHGLKKGLSALIATIIIFANTAPVISYAADNLKSQEELEKQKVTTNNSNIEFDVYYDEGEHTKELDINSQEESINVRINVKNAGYLKDITVDFSGSNFNVAQSEGSKAIVDRENKTATFDQINNGSDVVEKVNISAIIDNQISTQNFAKDNDIKLTATYINAKGKEEKIEKTIVLQTIWTMLNKVDSNLTYNINSYYPYADENENKLIMFGSITSGMQNGSLPIKNTTIEIQVPQLNNKYPEEALVYAKSTLATNGDAIGTSFTKDNYVYNSEYGKLTISVDNIEQDGNVSWVKNALDEYGITYVYLIEKEDIENVKEHILNSTINMDASSKITLYGNNDIIEKSFSEKLENIEQTTNSISTQINTVQTLNKGYMYTNKKSIEEYKNETEYEVTYNTNIPYSNIVESVVVNLRGDNALVGDTILKTEDALSYIKAVKIPKEQFDKILGENGSVTIRDNEGNILNTITKDTEDYMCKLDEEYYAYPSVIIEFSKPITEGSIQINAEKAIIKDLTYTESQIKSLTGIKIESDTFIQYTNQLEETDSSDIVNTANEKVIKLEEPTPKAHIEITPDTISTESKNQLFEINIVLETDTIDDTLYNEPKITINLPDGISTFAMSDPELLFDQELKISEYNIIDNDDGTKSVEIHLSGEQTRYNNIVAQGTTISISASITLDENIKMANKEIKAIIENKDQTKTETTTNIKYVVPTGVVTETEVTGLNNETIIAKKQDVNTVIPAKSEAKDITFNMNVTNNYENSLDNIIILGRIPNDETTQFKLKNGINIENIPSTIYYSKIQNATTDLTNPSNEWKTNVDDYSEIKSYMIILDNYTLEQGNSFKFSYTTTIPSNIGYEKNLSENYEIYFNNNLSTGTISDKVIAPKINFITGEDIKLVASMKVKEKSESTLLNRMTVTYELTITNQSSTDANDVTARIYTYDSAIYVDGGKEYILMPTDIPKEYYEFIGRDDLTEEEQKEFDLIKAEINQMKEKNAKGCKNIEISTIKGNESVTKELTLVFNKGIDEKKVDIDVDIILNHEVIHSAKAEETDLGTVKFNVNAQFVDTTQNYMITGSKIDYMLTFSSFLGDLNNVELNINLPKELKYINSDVSSKSDTITDNIKIENSNNNVTIKLEKLDSVVSIIMHLEIGELDEGVHQKEISITGKAKSDEVKEFDIQNVSVIVNNPLIAIEQTSSIPNGKKINGGEEYSYIFTIQNLSNISLQNVKLTDYLPDNVIYKSFTITSGDKIITSTTETDENENPIIEFYLEANGTVVATLNVQAETVDNETTIKNKAILSNNLAGEIETNEITHIIRKYGDITEPGDDNEQDTDLPSKGNKIVGTVWIDANENGIKDVQEIKVSGVEVILLDNNTGKTAITNENNEATTITSEEGTYIFDNLKNGSYTVIFLYDSENYKATEFEKNGEDITLTSKAIDKKISIDGKESIAAVTEEINLGSKNISDINLGLISNKKFDLKLDKTITNIKLNNENESTTHTYNSNFAKIDIEAKNVESTTMIIEYRFKITNEGEIPGYVKKLADYIPSELKFSSELNPDWYEASNGLIINNSLANNIINPGESVEVKLTLTKNMTNDSMGIVIQNTAEIYEATNDYGLQDKDSTPGNKQTNEDDMSTANVLTSVKTGQPVYYIALSITVMFILLAGIYTIRKKVVK